MSITHDMQFVAFAGYTYYPSPGWTAHIGVFVTLDEAIHAAKEAHESVYGGDSWWQVVALDRLEIVAGEGEGHTGLFGAFPANPNK